MIQLDDQKTYPGINPQVKLIHFTEDEQKIIKKISGEWYITNGGGEFNLGPTSQYKYFLIKPTDNYKELFNIELEIIVIFSNYTTFETRSLDAVDFVEKKYQSLRLEKLCCVLISNDENVVDRIGELAKNDQESQIVVPFSYSELLSNSDSYFLRNRFKAHFYTRDLFAFESPLKKDLYFFGRSDLVLKLVNRHKSNENTALFGLRKTGKTSVIFGVKRVLDSLGEHTVFIDCQNPSMHKRRWNSALWYILEEIKNQVCPTLVIKEEIEFTELNAALQFESVLKQAKEKLKEKSILIVFDEIENITFNTSPSQHWTNDLDFVLLWQSIRTVFQKNTNLFSFFIVGTNPNAIETAQIKGKDNPIFNQIYFEYIPNFDVPQTREMVRKLGRIMGLQFEEIIYSKLTEDFGGHPFLIRHVCSIINKISDSERPIRVDKYLYEKAKAKFHSEFSSYVEMILGVLKNFYPSEFDMLKYIALDDMKTFNELAIVSPEFTNHLLGYKIIDKNNDHYSFKIDAIKDYLLTKHKYEKALDSPKERYKEISERRNSIEPKLRKIARNQLLAHLGKADATVKYLAVLGDPRKTKYSGLSYSQLFNARDCEIYFEDIRKTIIKHYDIFKNIFGSNKDDFDHKMQVVNKFRSDAHAKDVTKEEMDVFRLCISYIETKIEEFID
ncbi:AAA family ATPase [Flavobacterium sp. UGB4466]|uniref:AAA family ATPase n=1 Tax=Flavobacterium sp. UGB4466 TaxID=2730889 RepID=UPI00192C6D6E|nr:AAA family ATPase [Flavobacterium sp. UGB4466]